MPKKCVQVNSGIPPRVPSGSMPDRAGKEDFFRRRRRQAGVTRVSAAG